MDYFDINLDLTDEDLALRAAAHKFAKQVMRPAAKELDRMTNEEVVADGSPLWDFLKKAYEQGYHKVLMPDHVGGLGLSPVQIHLVYEELGWGSFGLTVLLAVMGFPAFCAVLSNDEQLIDKFAIPFCNCTDGSIRGCWAITEPDHGSDQLGLGEAFFSNPDLRCSAQAKLEGDHYVISGQKSAWVSGGTISTVALVHSQIDRSKGIAGSGVCIVPLDLPGVSRGKPLDKIGQRDLNQGEIYFDEVRIPKTHMIVEPDFYPELLETILGFANLCMSIVSTGLARAAFEEAFSYCRQRVQGGRTLMEHASIKQRIFKMFSRVETCRALSRAAANLNFNVSPPVAEYSLLAKTMATQMCFENAHEAVQLLGGNGLTKEYLAEKLFRDARATLIEDGNNETLERHGGHILFESYPRSPKEI
ncbi:MAG: acyl-CoA dehydrogenase family protein [Syntrophobacteraceae bacterium]